MCEEKLLKSYLDFQIWQKHLLSMAMDNRGFSLGGFYESRYCIEGLMICGCSSDCQNDDDTQGIMLDDDDDDI